MNPAPANRSAHGRPWGRRFAAFVLIAIRHSSGWLFRLFLSLVLLLAVVFAYLHIVGLPAWLSDVFLDRMARHGYHLQIERLTLEIDRGLVAGGIRLYATAQAPEPFLTARDLTVALHPGALFRHGRLVPVLAIHDGRLKARPGPARLGAREGVRDFVADEIDLRFSASDREILLRRFEARFLGIRFRGRGGAYLPPPADRPAQAARSAEPPANPLAVALQALEDAPEWFLRLAEQVNALEFHSPPLAEFTFAAYPGHPAANTVALRLEGADGGRAGGVEFDGLYVDVSWQNQRLHFPDIQLHKAGNTLGLSGWLDATNQTVFFHLVNTLPLGTLLPLVPAEWRRPITESVADPFFPWRLDVEAGPAPLARVAEQMSGHLVAAGLRLRDVPIHDLDLTVSRAGDRITLPAGRIQFDEGAWASRLTFADGAFDLARSNFQARIEGTINPHVLKPWLTTNMQAIVDWFGIQEPLQGQVLVSGTVGNPAIACSGPIQATNFTINGAAVQFMQGNLLITNEVMHITGATLVRPEGLARGDVHMAFSNQTLRLDVDSTLDPRATAQMLGPGIAAFMEPFQLNGPVRVQVEGLLDYCSFALNRLQAHVEARRFGYDRWEADTAVFDLTAVGRRIRFTNAVATAYGGVFSGHGRLYPVERDAHWRYEMELEAIDARLNDLLAASYGKPMGDLRGTLNGSGRFGGYIGVGTGPQATGTGRVDIRNGLIFQTRLFNGLSSVLGKVFSDFNLFAQTDAGGSFAIRNSQVHSRDIELKGSLFSVKASGRYGFDGDLRYRVEVQPLRGGPVAALLRLAARPVTRLLEFRLTGTFEDPRWRPVNLNPADLFE